MTLSRLHILCLMTFGLLPAVAMAQVQPASASAAATPVKKLDNKQPIEITSDSLEVYQEENRAVFIGHVVAIQGDLRLKSDKMIVFYRKPDDNAETGQKAPKPPKIPGQDNAVKQDAIRRIEVEGNVFFSTPEDTATGLTGNYDTEKHEIHLDSKVLLTRGNNTLKGEHLTYNLDTGQSVLIGGPEASASAQQPQALPSGRVRALFIPEDKNANKPAKDKTNAAKTSDTQGVKTIDTQTANPPPPSATTDTKAP